MWEIRCIVSDKHALNVMKLLDGHTLEPPIIMQVHGAHNGAQDKTARPPQSPSGSSVEQLQKFIHGRKIVTPREMRVHLEKAGYSKNGYSYALSLLQKQGALKKSKKFPRRYEVS